MRRLHVLLLGIALLGCTSERGVATPTTAASATSAAPAPSEPPSTSSTSTTSPTATTVPDTITVLVTNDDGVDADGIDVLVRALSTLGWVELVVVAPADDRSGTGDTTTDGTVSFDSASTPGGHPATAVQGYPADAVLVALDRLGVQPDLVVSGINRGQNVGPSVEISGTIGAARTAARRGIPALATSAGGASDRAPDYDTVAALVLEWLAAHREGLLAGELPVRVLSINAPTCASGSSVRGLLETTVLVEVPAGQDAAATDCTSTAPAPPDDVTAMNRGFATLSDVGY